MLFTNMFNFMFNIMFLFFLMTFTNMWTPIISGSNYFGSEFLLNFLVCFKMDLIMLIFCCMVCLVTSLVLIYSESYMESYKNLKFFILTLIFFLSMVALVMSFSGISFIMGWDYLGISSILLVMFYMNKTTVSNSILTMVFNRIGDAFLIFCLCIMIFDFSFFMYFDLYSTIFFFLFLFTCSLTKSAQFPFSSWLPAAMSAPTPISAMVHSSTLVTAGVYVVVSFEYFFLANDFLIFFCWLSILSFVLGGLMANFELDLKKMVAFSTMSQISLIYFFCSWIDSNLGLSHMFFHALFKSMLFCSAGILFYKYYSSQNILECSTADMKLLHMIFLICLFSMSGLTFSSSFFSKDVAIEMLLGSDSFFLFLILILGSFMTLTYSCKLFFVSTKFSINKPFFLMKMFFGSFYFFFLLICLLCWSFMYLLGVKFCVSMGLIDMMILVYLFYSILILKFNFKFQFSSLSYDISYMKLTTYFYLSLLFNKFSYFFSNDLFFLSNSIYKKVKFSNKLIGVNFLFIPLVIFSYFFF